LSARNEWMDDGMMWCVIGTERVIVQHQLLHDLTEDHGSCYQSLVVYVLYHLPVHTSRVD
jgi:hypothetical protein